MFNTKSFDEKKIKDFYCAIIHWKLSEAESYTKTLCFSKTDSRNFPTKHNSRNGTVLYVCFGYARAFNHTAGHLRSSVLVMTLVYRLVGARRAHTRSVVYSGQDRYYNNYYNFMLILRSPSATILFFYTSFLPVMNVLTTYTSVFCKKKKKKIYPFKTMCFNVRKLTLDREKEFIICLLNRSKKLHSFLRQHHSRFWF